MSRQSATRQTFQDAERRALGVLHGGNRYMERLLERAMPGKRGVQHLVGETRL
jgi:hypothetical protein